MYETLFPSVFFLIVLSRVKISTCSFKPGNCYDLQIGTKDFAVFGSFFLVSAIFFQSTVWPWQRAMNKEKDTNIYQSKNRANSAALSALTEHQ